MQLHNDSADFIRAQNLSRRFTSPGRFWQKKGSGELALNQVSFSCQRHERVGLVGASGSGKSTLLRILLGLDTADSGDVFCEGHDIKPASVRALRWYRQRVQYIAQDPAASLPPHQTVAQVIGEPVKHLTLEAASDALLRQALEQVELSATLLNQSVGLLSGGQAQRVAIARALATKPAFLLADEPVSGLDLPLKAQIKQLLKQVTHEQGMGLLMVTHDFSMLTGLCDRTLVMHNGEIIEGGATDRLLCAPQHRYTQQLIAAIPRLTF